MSVPFEPSSHFAFVSNPTPESADEKSADEKMEDAVTPAVWPPPPTLAPPVAAAGTPEPGLLTRRAELDAAFGFALGASGIGFLAALLFLLPPDALRWLAVPLLLVPSLVGGSVILGGAGVAAYRYLNQRWPAFADGGLAAVLLGLLAFTIFFLLDALSR